MSNYEWGRIQEAYNRTTNRRPDPAILGDSNDYVTDTDNPNSGLVWIRYATSNGLSTAVKVRGPYTNSGVTLRPGQKVWIGWDSDGERYVMGKDFAGTRATGDNPNPPEPTASGTTQQSILTLLPFASTVPDLNVNFKAYGPIINGVYTSVTGITKDYTSVLPSAGNMRYVTAFIKSDFTIELKGSTERSIDSVPLSDADINENLANASSGSVAIWSIPLSDNPSAITQPIINAGVDHRQWLNTTNAYPSTRIALTNQTATITATDILTPFADGEYTVSVVLTDTTASVSGGAVVASILYDDENGAQSQSTASVLLSALGYTASIFTFHATTAAAIQYSTTVSGVIVGSPEYSLYINVTRIG